MVTVLFVVVWAVIQVLVTIAFIMFVWSRLMIMETLVDDLARSQFETTETLHTVVDGVLSLMVNDEDDSEEMESE